MKKMVNGALVEGRVYEYELSQKVSQKGATYIKGHVDVATDEACLNIVRVNYNYVGATYNNGNENKTYATLLNFVNICDANGAVIKPKTVKAVMDEGVGKDNATMVKLSPAVGLNDFYVDENGTDVLVSNRELQGGFAHIVASLNADEAARNKFDVDMVITNTFLIEGDEEAGTVDKLSVKGCAFDFRGAMLPIELSVTNPNGISYFENLDATPSTPVFTKVWGKIVNETIVTTRVEESAFGDAQVIESKKTKRDWVITGTAKESYDFGAEGVLTHQELRDAVAARETYLAEVLQKRKDYLANKTARAANTGFGVGVAASTPASGSFGF